MSILTKEKPILVIYSSLYFVDGYTKTMVIDVQREKSYQLPNFLASIIQELNGKDAFDYVAGLSEDDKLTFNDYLFFLLDKEIIFFTSMALKDAFPEISKEFDLPYTVTNIIIDVTGISLPHLKEVFFKSMGHMGIQAVQLRGYSVDLYKIFDFFEYTRIKDIELVLYDTEPIKDFDYKKLDHAGIFCVYVSIEELEPVIKEAFLDDVYVVCTANVSQSQIKNSCGVVGVENFMYNQQFYLESLSHNTCLNRKISIDINGDIKNCPSMPQSFGNIKDTTLEEALNHPDFKKYWNIKKDDITKCKDCEFRYICTDCRAYIEDPDDIYSAPLKCGYDPYTGEWEEWSTNPLKQKAIQFYGMEDLVKKASK